MNMIEYLIENIHTEETRIVWGYNLGDACERYCVTLDDYMVLAAYYVD